MKKAKIKVLIISNTPWRSDNSFGNSYSSIFGGISGLEFANVYCNYGSPDNNIVSRHFQITEKSLIRNFLNRKHPSGIEIKGDYSKIKRKDNSLNRNENKILNSLKKSRWQIYFWMRDLIWFFGKWKTPQLEQFIKDFNPDLIFQPLYYSNYLNNIVLYAKDLTSVPMVAYVSDDVYTLRQFSMSPLYWIDRFIKRSKIGKVVKQCEFLYVISEIQKNDYEIAFNKKCKILTKGAYFNQPEYKKNQNKPLKLVFTGNIGGGRWQSLAMIGKALSKINKTGSIAQLIIYTPTPLTKKMKKELSEINFISLNEAVPSAVIPDIQSDADILVHVEPLSLKGKLAVRQSFSTKIVDYLYAARPILAIGWKEAASIKILHDNNVGLVASSQIEIEGILGEILNNPNLLDEYSKKAWEFGKANFQIQTIQSELYEDLTQIVSK